MCRSARRAVGSLGFASLRLELDLHRWFDMRRRAPGSRGASLAVIAVAMVVGACGSEVVITDDEDELDLRPPAGEQGGGPPGAVSPGTCYPCAVADCSICFDLPGATHRCDEGQPAPSCVQLGGLFEDGGDYYTCWSCL